MVPCGQTLYAQTLINWRLQVQHHGAYDLQLMSTCMHEHPAMQE